MTPATFSQAVGTRRLLRTLGWTLLTLAIVAAAASTVDLTRVLAVVAGADRRVVAAVASLLLLAIAFRGLVLWTALRAVGAPVGLGRGLVTYLAVAFVNTLAPGGGAGGTPVAGLLIARSARTDFEAGVAATLTVSTLTNLVVGAFGVLGLFALLVTGGPDDLLVLAGLGVALFLLGVTVAVWLWRVRTAAGHRVLAGTTAFLAVLERRLPWAVPDGATVERHAATFAAALERLAGGSPAQTAALVGFSAAAHVLSVLALYLAFAALGVPVSLGVLLAVIPTAILAALTPAPGAAGGVEVALGALLAAATGQPVAAVGAAVLIYRGSGYAFRIVLGGLAVLALALFR